MLTNWFITHLINITLHSQETQGRKKKTLIISRKNNSYFANKGAYTQSYGFSSSHVWM